MSGVNSSLEEQEPSFAYLAGQEDANSSGLSDRSPQEASATGRGGKMGPEAWEVGEQESPGCRERGSQSACPRAIVVAGTGVGVGKTTIALGLMACLRDAGHKVAAFKIGPDFLGPTLHEVVTGRRSGNLDGWMMSREHNLDCFHSHAAGADIAVVEGVVGLFDGRDGATEDGSTAQMAKWLGAPVVLVLDCEGMGRSVAAVLRGYETFDPDLNIAGVILNRVGGASQLEWLRTAFQSSGVKATLLAGLPKDESLVMLNTTQMRSLPGYFDRVCKMVAKRVDVEALLQLATITASPWLSTPPARPPSVTAGSRVKIGVAQDEAFCFYYEQNLALLVDSGAELVPFSPISQPLPLGLSALYFGGGFPEQYASQLSENFACVNGVRAFAGAGGVIFAECAGLMYLSQSIEPLDSGPHPTVGLFPFRCRMTRNRTKMGYVEAETQAEGGLLPAGLKLRGHFFHFSEVVQEKGSSPGVAVPGAGGDSSGVEDGWVSAFSARLLPWEGAPMAEGYSRGRVLASQVHLHWGSEPRMASALVEAASQVDVHEVSRAVEQAVLEEVPASFSPAAKVGGGQQGAGAGPAVRPDLTAWAALEADHATTSLGSAPTAPLADGDERWANAGAAQRNLHESLSATDVAAAPLHPRHRHNASMPAQLFGSLDPRRLTAHADGYKAALGEMGRRLRDLPARWGGGADPAGDTQPINPQTDATRGQLGYNRQVRHQPGGTSASWQSLTSSPEYGSRGMWTTKGGSQPVPLWFHTVSPRMPARPSQQELILDDGTRVIPMPGHLVSPHEVAAGRIVSFLPSATEIIFALHLENRLIGVSDLCDYPPQVAGYPIVVRSKVDAARMPSEEVARRMAELRASGESPFAIDEDFLRREAPGLVLTQDTCNICSTDSSAALVALRNAAPEGGTATTTLVLGPRTVAQVLTCILQIGSIAGVADVAAATVDALQVRLRRVVARVASSPRARPRVLSLEGLSPLVMGGHWLPDMKRMAGGIDTLQEPGDRAEQISWETLRSYAPDVLILSPCSSDLQRSLREVSQLADLPGWWGLPAVRNGQVYICQHSYFSRPGPRLVGGIEILARILHPEACHERVPEGAVLKLTLSGGRRCRHRLLPNYFAPFL